MDIKQKLLSIFDEASFVETDAYLTSRQSSLDSAVKGDGVLSGYGTIDGRLVYAACQDSTFLGGALGEMHAHKIAKVINLAVSVGAPVMILFDSQGARLKEGLSALAGYGEIMSALSNASGMVPVISVCIGNAYGATSYTAEMADFVVMTTEGKMAVSSPAILKANDNNAKDKTGNYEFNMSVSGNADLVCQPDELPSVIRSLLALLPDNNLEGAPWVLCTDDLNRSQDELVNVTDIRTILGSISDNGAFLELKSNFATEVITALARFNGKVVGVVANNGLLTCNALSKAARFVRYCDGFNIPLLTLTDAQGFAVSAKEEENNIVKCASKLVFAFTGATVPKLNIIVNNAFGGAYVIMNSKHIGADFVYAWEKASISPLSDQASAVILFQNEIAASDDPVKTREEKANEYREKYSNPVEAAKLGYVDDVIDPSETRVRVISAFEMLAGKRAEAKARKHSNINL